MITTLFVIGSLIFGKAILLFSLAQLENKVDVTVYFKPDASEKEALSLKDSLAKLEEVKSVDYVSREEALEAFRKRHADNFLIIQSLEELGDNPLGASLNIKAKEVSQYESIVRFLEAGAYASIDKINYRQNKRVIDRLSNILATSKKLGAIVSLILVVVAVLVTFNTIRLAIYSNREEIKIMRLVGATNRYIRGPFLIEGVLYGFISTVITMLIFYPLTLWLGPRIERFFGEINIFHYYLNNFFELFLVLGAIGIGVGVFSSWVSTRRYLKI
jgi:cell division transport system permease protein